MNIGLFGGTFDPPHTGHLIVAQDAALALGLDRVLFVPAAVPPHKQDRSMTAAPQRAQMLELATAGDPRFALSRLELERGGPSYTVDTLRALAGEHSAVAWTLLIGADQYAEFETWRAPEAIRQLARVAVLTRGGGDGAGGTSPGGAARAARPAASQLPNGDVRVEVTRIDISATAIRRRVAAGAPIRYMVPAAVEAFIFEQGLYTTETALR